MPTFVLAVSLSAIEADLEKSMELIKQNGRKIDELKKALLLCSKSGMKVFPQPIVMLSGSLRKESKKTVCKMKSSIIIGAPSVFDL